MERVVKNFVKRVSKLPTGAVGLTVLAAAGIIAILLILRPLGHYRGRPSVPERRPNVLLLTIDTLRADALGFAGNRKAGTPVLDRLATGGARFSVAYAHNTTTLPSHANILSGRLPFEHGVRDNAGARFPTALETLATLLRPRGYRTGAFVSAFPLDSRFGLARGFDVYDDRFVDDARPAFLEQERPGPETVRLALQWIRSADERPYFCWVHLYEPHFPYRPDYRSDVEAMDRALGPLLNPILDAGATDRTLVVFTSDHGESLGEHGEATHGIFAYDATLRVPLVLYAPRLWSGRTIESPAFHVDLLPTIMDVLGVTLPPALPGRSLVKTVIAGRAGRLDERPIYFEALSGALNRGWAPLHGVVSGGFKYIDLPIPELYDLKRDPSERENIATSSPERVQALRSLLEGWTASASTAPAGVPIETAAVRERLRSLGYVTGGASRASSYTAADDPKTLIVLDRLLQEVIGLYADGQLTAALEKCRELIARRPQMAVSWLHLAHLEREAGNIGAGVEALRRANALNPQDPETAALLGSYLTEAGRPDEAVAVLEPFAASENADPQALEAAALALARLGRFDEAVRALDRALLSDPTSGGLLVHLGTVQLMAGRRDQARASFERAVALNPVLPRAHSSLAALAAENGETSAALEHWRRAAALDSGEFRTVLAVAISLIRRGREKEGRAYLEFFAASAPESRYAADVKRARAYLARPSQPSQPSQR